MQPPRRSLAVLAALAVAVAVSLSLVACSDSDDSATGTTTTTTVAAPQPVSGLVATIQVSRLFSLQRALAVGLRNVGDEPIVVREIRLDTSIFGTEPLAAREVLLRPGGRELVMPVPYGRPVCGGDTREPRFAAIVMIDDGEEVRLDAPEKDAGGIARLHTRECASEAVSEAADLHFGEEWTQDGRSVTGELVLEQLRDGVSANVDEVAGTVIFGVEVDDEDPPILEVSNDRPTASIPVVVSADRCDPHALIESKKTFVFLAWISLEGAEPVPVEVRPTGNARAVLDDLLASCLE